IGGKSVLTKGHRRVAACVVLARKQAIGFRDDMELDAIEVLETDPTELLVRSILDNAIRKSLDQVERIRAAHTLFRAGVHEGRAAEALGVSVQSYKRDLLIAGDAWMFQHVVKNHVNPTAATLLLKAMNEVANDDPRGRVQFQGEIDRWVAAKAAELARKDKILQAKRGKGKGLSEADKQVKRYLSNQLAAHWADLIRQGAALDDDAEWTFQADLDLEKDLLQIGGVRLDLAKDPVRKLAEVASKLSQLAKEIGPILKRRHAEGQRPRAAGKAVVRDVEYLKGLGLDDLAAEYEREQRELAAGNPDGGADPDFERQAPRPERDLAAEVEGTGAAEADDEQADDEGGAP
ncbi:MAG: hypothetical protein JO034_21315, partial [Singulisphaera sp.]|nr:hypothetical protein [Singulisphaera sp.]